MPTAPRPGAVAMATIGSFSRDNIATIVALRALAARFDAPREKRARRLTGALFALAREERRAIHKKRSMRAPEPGFAGSAPHGPKWPADRAIELCT